MTAGMDSDVKVYKLEILHLREDRRGHDNHKNMTPQHVLRYRIGWVQGDAP